MPVYSALLLPRLVTKPDPNVNVVADDTEVVESVTVMPVPLPVPHPPVDGTIRFPAVKPRQDTWVPVPSDAALMVPPNVTNPVSPMVRIEVPAV